MLARAAWDIGTERPWLGIGEGAFGPALERWVARESALHPGDRSWAVAAGQVVRANDAHNALLQAWLDCGIPGLLLLVGAVGTVALRLWRRAARDAASGAGFAVSVAVLVGVPTSVMFAKAPLALVAVCLVLAVAPPARTRAG